jgi:hypothetical protein
MAIYPVRQKGGITYTAVRPVCCACSEPLTGAQRELGLAFCDGCALGLAKRDVLRPAPLRRRSPALKALGHLGFALLCVAGMAALYLGAHLLERGL